MVSYIEISEYYESDHFGKSGDSRLYGDSGDSDEFGDYCWIWQNW